VCVCVHVCTLKWAPHCTPPPVCMHGLRVCVGLAQTVHTKTRRISIHRITGTVFGSLTRIRMTVCDFADRIWTVLHTVLDPICRWYPRLGFNSQQMQFPLLFLVNFFFSRLFLLRSFFASLSITARVCIINTVLLVFMVVESLFLHWKMPFLGLFGL